MNNKVYINPKFNRKPTTILPQGKNNKMHVNPNFSQYAMQNNSKIYVNPHFIQPNVSCAITQNEISYNHTETSKTDFSMGPPNMTENIEQNFASKSRYSLVRQTGNQVLRNQTNIKTTTIKINKYKSVAVAAFKKKLEIKLLLQENDKLGQVREQVFLPINKEVTTLNPKLITQYSSPSSSRRSSSKNHNIKSRFKVRNEANEAKGNILISSPFKSKIKRSLKKNNIPCPLFKKYGKCLRSVHGTCEFLHDKKHVSICRMFLKGICHDKSCLLSHEINSKKMPSCYFYLKGMCSKEHCPYVHVKLNEKTKICVEFIKGYCEKGDKCLHRHVDVNQGPDKIKRSKKYVRPWKMNKTKPTQVNKYRIIATKNITRIAKPKPEQETQNNPEFRYYKEQESVENVGESSQVIKPTRCKLGTLPSFIKF